MPVLKAIEKIKLNHVYVNMLYELLSSPQVKMMNVGEMTLQVVFLVIGAKETEIKDLDN